MKTIITFLFLTMSLFLMGQNTVQGIVTDPTNSPVFAANVFLKKHQANGVITGFDGNFKLVLQETDDTLVISFLGFETQEIPIKNLDFQHTLHIVLKENQHSLPSIIIEAQDPISEQFSVIKMEKLDVYFNPIAQGDPLKAITILPSSTTTDESANPSLRGSSADRSRVILNGVPIYNPVRSSQLNNQGFFSLFNPEIISQQYIYASNPPLTHGNTSAGLVEIQTNNLLEKNQIQLSSSLASFGLFFSKKLNQEKYFVQAYSNFQFSDAYINLNQKNIPRLNKFYTKDFGLNFHAALGKKSSINTFHYLIDEGYDFKSTTPSFEGNSTSAKQRYFIVNNYRRHTDRGIFSINNGLNFSKSKFQFGNLDTKNSTQQIFTSINYKWFIFENWEMQFGSSYDFHQQEFRDSFPDFFYSFSPETPYSFSSVQLENHNWEAYLYSNWKINKKLLLSSGWRSNFPNQEQKHYLSWQTGLKYLATNHQYFLLSYGKYHNYSNPTFFNQTFNLQSSFQLALDYTWEKKNTTIKTAIYHKNEKGDRQIETFFNANKIQTTGVELFFQQDIYNYFQFTLSNAFIEQTMTADEKKYIGSKDYNYLLKATLQFSHPKLFTTALTYQSRPGNFYTPIFSGTWNETIEVYQPNYSVDFFSQQYGNYHLLDLNINRYFAFKKYALIAFISVSNILNSKNEREVLYHSDYSDADFDYYQLRSVYFGMVWQL